MKLYRTRTQQEYDWLMRKLEDEFHRWESGDLPTEYDGFYDYGDQTVIEGNNEEGWGLLYNHITHAKDDYPNEPIIEVSELMEEEKIPTHRKKSQRL